MKTVFLSKSHPANRMQKVASFRPSAPPVELEGLAAPPLTNFVKKQLDQYCTRHAMRAVVTAGAWRPRKSQMIRTAVVGSRYDPLVDPPLTGDDIRALTADAPYRTVGKDAQSFGQVINSALIRQWSPDTLEKTISLLKLKRDIKRSHNPTDVTTQTKQNRKGQPRPCGTAAEQSRRKLIQPNLNERLEKLKHVSDTYKGFLVDSIQLKLMLQGKPSLYNHMAGNRLLSAQTLMSSPGSSPTMKVTPLSRNASKSRRRPQVSAADNNKSPKAPAGHNRLVSAYLPTPAQAQMLAQFQTQRLVPPGVPRPQADPEGKLGAIMRRHSSRLLLAKRMADVSAQEQVRKFFEANPLTRANFHRVQTVDREFAYLTHTLGKGTISRVNAGEIVAMFRKRHRGLRNSLLTGSVAELPPGVVAEPG